MNLSRREEQVLKMAAEGCTVYETALLLRIGVSTVRNYKASMKEKLGAVSTPNAVWIYAQELAKKGELKSEPEQVTIEETNP